jgi:hypothetical protein
LATAGSAHAMLAVVDIAKAEVALQIRRQLAYALDGPPGGSSDRTPRIVFPIGEMRG